MSTTTLFVELLVIGAGATAWLVALFLALLNFKLPNAVPKFETELLILGLPLVYVLGILADRLADSVFESLFVRRARERYFPNPDDYYAARRAILTSASPMAELLEYGRSRMRICRGWAFNAVLALVPANMMLSQAKPGTRAVIVANVALVLLAVLCWWCWRRLADTEYRKLKQGAGTSASPE